MNKKYISLCGALIFSGSLLFGINTDTKTFFAGPKCEDIKLPADKVYPMGRKFPFGFYSTGGCSEPERIVDGVKKRSVIMPLEKRMADTKKIVDGGATFIGPQYELNVEILETAKKFNVQCAYTISGIVNGKRIDKIFFRGKDKLDVEAMRKETAPVIRELAKNPEIAYWNVTPEERRFWKKREMIYLEEMYKLIKENDPLKRPVFMYEPGHRGADALAKTLAFMDICAKGTYTNYSGHKDNRVWVRYSMEKELEAVKICKKGIPFLLPEMFRQPEEKDLPLVEKWVKHDVYCGVANGAKGVMVFSARRRPTFTAWEKYIDAYLETAKVLSGELGQALLFGKDTTDLEVSVIEGAEKVEARLRKGEKTTYPSLSVKQMVWNNARYVLIVNSAETPVKAMVDNLVYGSTIKVKDLLDAKADKFTAPEGNFEVELAPLQAVCFKVYCEK